jgi:charged multivesicular body protein 7
MSVMMYVFRPREVNPEHYDQKMRFWIEMIENYCEYKGSSSFSVQELKDVFKRKGTSPYCLEDVINQMMMEGKALDKVNFMSNQKQTWGQWGLDMLVYKPVSWTFNKLKEKVVGGGINPETLFVSMSAVRNQAKLLQDHVRSAHSYNNIISMEELMKTVDDIEGLSKDGILMALQYLSNVEKCVYIEENKSASGSHHHKLLLKFTERGHGIQPITELERTMYNLETTEHFLTEKIEKKEQELEKVLQQAKSCVKDGKKQLAKTLLKKKHNLENDLTKTMHILDNIQSMMQRVHNSKNDKEILQTYKVGAESIKRVFAESGINMDNVYDVIEDMQEVMSNQDEFESAISTPLKGNANEIDDSELEAELMSLVNDNNKDNNAGNAVNNGKANDCNLMDLELRLKRLRGELPDIPDSIPEFTPSAKVHKPLMQM